MTRAIEVTEEKVSEELSWRDKLLAVPRKAAEAQPQKVCTPDVEPTVVLSVLAKARHDTTFLAHLSENPDKALEDHELTHEAKAALASRVIHWLDLFGDRRPGLRPPLRNVN